MRLMKAATIRARVDRGLKDEAESVFAQLGLSTTDAIRLFLTQVLLRRGLPFEIAIPIQDNSDLLVKQDQRRKILDSFYDD
jgi:DNA-damage-inducible protein J